MAVAVSDSRGSVPVPPPVTAAEAGPLQVSDVFARLGSGAEGLAEGEAARRLRVVGPNAVRSYRARAWPVLRGQLRSPLLLLAVTALASAFLGQASDAVIILVILVASVGLGAALLAATVVPLSTAYAIAETAGVERSLSRKLREARPARRPARCALLKPASPRLPR